MNKNDQDFLVQKIRTQYMEKEREKIAPEIIRLSDELMK